MTVAVVIAARHIPGARGLATLVRDDGDAEGGEGGEGARAPSHG
jgi:hypothetical protein